MRELFKQGVPVDLRGKQKLTVGDKVYYIEQGYVGLYVQRTGNEHELMFIFKDGEIFPLADKVMPYEKDISISYITIKQTKLLSVPRSVFENYSLETPARARQLVDELQNQLALALNRVDTMSYSRVYSKLIARLIFFANRFGTKQNDTIRIDIPLTYGDIAASIGTTRETVNRLMSRMQSDGLLEVNNRYITIKSIDTLNSELKTSINN